MTAKKVTKNLCLAVLHPFSTGVIEKMSEDIHISSVEFYDTSGNSFMAGAE